MILSRRALLPLLLPTLPGPARAESLDLGVLMAGLASVAERRASFREERRLAALTTPLISTGRLYYRRPDYLEKETLWPLRERMVIAGNRMIVSDPASNDPPHVVPLDVDAGLRVLIDGMRAPLAGDLGALQRIFVVSATGVLAAWTLLLKPTDIGARKLLTQISLIGQERWISTITITQADGDVSTLQITPT